MASSSSPSAASTGLPSARDSPLLTEIEQLLDDLGFQRILLASLHDLPETSSRRQEIADEIATIQHKLAEARRKGAPMGPNMGDANGSEECEGIRPNHGTSAFPNNLNPMSSSHGGGSRTASRKRSIGSSHLVDPWNGEPSKSRRTTPSAGPGVFGSGLGNINNVDDFQSLSVIDLTGDDDEAWRSTIQRQKDAEDRLSRRKEDADRDAALARQLAGRSSPSPSGPRFAEPSRLGQNNAFTRILGRSPLGLRRPSHVKPEPGNIKSEPGHVESELSPTLPSRPRVPVKAEPGSFAGHSWNMAETEQNQYHVPGAWEDIDSEAYGARGPGRVLGGRSRPSLPSVPQLPSSYNHPANTPAGFGTNSSLRYIPNVPAIELARQSSMARQETPSSAMSPGWLPLGPVGQRLQSAAQFACPPVMGQTLPSSPSFGTDRPGFGSELATTIGRVNGYDFNAMLDAEGNQLNSRLVGLLDDYVNDPRKTEEDIQQLLSNIRPDMEIPQEERGETPESLKYPLYTHQQLALKWMSEMEEGTNKGGILADDMGLGKTISTLALMVSRPPLDNVKTNLIIGPVALIKQWEHEVKKKLKASHSLSVFLLHQKKKISFSDIKNYDVVLTTYGSVASEWKQYHKHVDDRNGSAEYNPETDMELAKKCPLLHPRSKFYRIILDEAQCIKNKDTQGSKGVHQINGTYRWCLTGTPMMNNVLELYPLIRFLKIRPYCDFRLFQRAFKSLAPRSAGTDYTRDSAMKQLQAVLKAMMLRRMKNSLIDGKPILSLPQKIESSEQVVFSVDEQQFYRDLEARSQVQFNKYLRAGTVGKNYSNILVLLLRLRQACCHPHLTDFDCVGVATPDTQMADLAKEMDAAVVERIKAIDAFECPICYDAVNDPILLIPCGHDTCSECFTSLTENSAQNNIRSGNENGSAKCPVCRGGVEPTKVINYTAFRKAHMPEALGADDAADEALDEVTDSDDSSEDDFDFETDSDADSGGNLKDFVVPDNEVDEFDTDDDARIDAELAAVAGAKKQKKATKSRGTKKAKKAKKGKKMGGKGKGKAKSEEVKPHMLTRLRLEARKNMEARRRYMHYLRDNWEDSAKVTQVVELLKEIQETDEKTIIFSQWTALLDLIECKIKYDLNLRYCCYTGGMSRNARDDAVQDFTENPRNKVMLVSLRAGNAGLNLTSASRIIICDPFWNPYIEMQAVDRAHRIGQQREVKVHRILVKETVEDRILELQEKKRQLVESALDEGESRNVGRLSAGELAYLFGVPSRG